MIYEELQHLIKQAAANKVTYLNLANTSLDFFPKSIGQLTHLASLDLSGNRLTRLPESIGQLTNLTSLDLSANQLTSLPDTIGQLTNLTSLELSYNQLASLPKSIGQLTHLASLDLSVNRLTRLPESIGQLTNLTSFSLSGNQLTSLPDAIGQLTNLTSFYLSGNQLTSLPKSIEQLTNLISLYLSDNQLTSLPDAIGQLTNLTSLYLSGNQLTSLPDAIGQLTNLTSLELSYNQLTSLPDAIGQLTNLASLDLGFNLLTSLPEWIGQFTNLRSLELRYNYLMKLPPEFGKLRLTRLTFGNNPWQNLPPEIRRGGVKAILRFCQQLTDEVDHLYEAKLLIIGEGGAGKTTLTKKIQDCDYQLQSDEVSTEGIDVIRWHFPLPNGKEFRVNIWDFGGQEIYHATHQFFLTKRSLYALVADTRKEDTDFYYWLNVAELLSENSPLLIIKNEKQERKREINERQLRGEFTNLKETIATNFATNRGLPDILNKIQHYIQNLPHVGTELPKSWVKVREALEKSDRNYISLDEYLKICEENGFTQQEDALQLSGYLHDLGVCLHFQDDDLLTRTVILKPTWGTDAVYKVLDNAQVVEALGRFTREDLKIIWHEDKYTTMRPELLRLMMNFKLCYEIRGSQNVYIAPQLLTPNQPEYTWDEVENLFLRYEYEFMPKGILTRFIVEMHSAIEHPTLVWKTGVVLCKDGARAEIIELYRYHKGEIRIRLSGKRKRDLLTTVRHELDKIHASYERLKYKTLVPCNCSTCGNSQTPFFFDLKRLYNFLDTDKPQIQCYDSGDDVEVRGLIDDIIKTSPRSTNPMSDSKYNFPKAEIVQIIENNSGEVIAKKYANDPAFTDALSEIVQILTTLQQNHPTATEKEAVEIIEAEFQVIKINQPNKWKTFQRDLLNSERWLKGGKSALSETAKHYLEDSVFAKAFLAFLDGFSAE
ncbi:MAG: leucine-rich repeat domain-containing protein [Pseudanabaena sp. M176S2SP2A07QC]|nr:leucine-rich repeat domain-containing protein [Pseudanabaena sp. M176S2SP2A07QC]